MDISSDALSTRTGMDVLHDMQYTFSPYELHILGRGHRALVEILVACGQETTANLLRWRIRDVSDFATSSRADAEARAKKAPERITVLEADATLKNWHNTFRAICRAFKLGPNSPVAITLARIRPDMEEFLLIRANTRPELYHNGFCAIYLNILLQDVCSVMEDPNSTTMDITQVLQNAMVSEDTNYYTQTMQQLDHTQKQRLETLWTAFQQPTKPNNSRQPQANNSKSAQSTKNSSDRPICCKFFSKSGCTTKRCRFYHPPTALTNAQRTAVRNNVAKLTTLYPSSTPIDIDEAKMQGAGAPNTNSTK